MPIAVQVFPTVQSRPCRVCLCLQGGSVFADFDVDGEGRVFLRRISFDGYGCCNGEFRSMTVEDSRQFLDAVDRGELESPEVVAQLRSYFAANSDLIWSDALEDHELL